MIGVHAFLGCGKVLTRRHTGQDFCQGFTCAEALPLFKASARIG